MRTRTDTRNGYSPQSGTVPISPAQLRKIWAVSHELSWDSARLHRYVGICFGVESLKLLSRDAAKRLIDDLERYVRKGAGRSQMSEARGEKLEGRNGQGYRERGVGVDGEGKMVRYVSPAQVALLRAEAARMHWGDAWIVQVASRTLHRPVWDIHLVRAEEAAKLVGAVRGFVDRRIAEKGYGDRRIQNSESRNQNSELGRGKE